MQIAKSCNHKRPCYDDGKCHFTKPCEHQYLTNADRIRAMSDEELAGWIYARIRITLERAGFSIDEDIPNESVVESTLDWLRQEAKE